MRFAANNHTVILLPLSDVGFFSRKLTTYNLTAVVTIGNCFILVKSVCKVRSRYGNRIPLI